MKDFSESLFCYDYLMSKQPDYSLVKPDPDRDASFALSWFSPLYGKETLLLMGNPEHSIKESTLDGEKETLIEFLELEKKRKQITWMIRVDEKTIGAVWIELEPTENVKAPAAHIMIGDIDYRGRGIGKSVMREMIEYSRNILKSQILYSRHLRSNDTIAVLMSSLGFVKDGEPCEDKDGLLWQNVKLPLRS